MCSAIFKDHLTEFSQLADGLQVIIFLGRFSIQALTSYVNYLPASAFRQGIEAKLRAAVNGNNKIGRK